MKHCFDTEIAKEYGLTEAILLQNIGYWVAKNKASNNNCIDGRHWTYNTIGELQEVLPYLTVDEIYRALERLKKSNILLAKNQNKNKFDRTLWYAFVEEGVMLEKLVNIENIENKETDAFCNLQNRYSDFAESILQKEEIDSAQEQNRFCTDANSLYTDINTNINSDINSEISLEENFVEAKEKTSTNLEAQKEKKKKRTSAALDSKEEMEIVMPFEHEEFKQKWSLWLTYRKDIKKSYKSKLSEQQALKTLSEESQHNVLIAIKMIEKAIGSGYQGIFPLYQHEINAITSTNSIQHAASNNGNFKNGANQSGGNGNFDLERLNSFTAEYYSKQRAAK